MARLDAAAFALLPARVGEQTRARREGARYPRPDNNAGDQLGSHGHSRRNVRGRGNPTEAYSIGVVVKRKESAEPSCEATACSSPLTLTDATATALRGRPFPPVHSSKRRLSAGVAARSDNRRGRSCGH